MSRETKKKDLERAFLSKSLNMTCMFTVFRVNYIFTLFYQKGSLNREYKMVARYGRQEKVLSSEVQNYLTILSALSLKDLFKCETCQEV